VGPVKAGGKELDRRERERDSETDKQRERERERERQREFCDSEKYFGFLLC